MKEYSGMYGFFYDKFNNFTLTVYSFKDNSFELEIKDLKEKKINTILLDKKDLRDIRNALNMALEKD